ncbi:MAG TPA: hypothetical protein VIV08_06600 [Acidimicrobiia bacterium]
MQSHPPEAKRRATAVAALTLATALVAVVPAVAQTAEPVTEEHCVVLAVDTASDGRLVLDEPECYPTVADAAEATEVALVDVAASNRSVSRSALASDSAGQQVTQASSKTLGIHYDGTSGSGSSITVVGSACTGGYWNASATWKNRISSTYNGCGRLKHYDKPSMVGTTYTTLGVGTTDNLSWFSNMTESVSYHAS